MPARGRTSTRPTPLGTVSSTSPPPGPVQSNERISPPTLGNRLTNPSSSSFSDDILRYGRQLLVPSFNVSGQERLLRSKVLVVGLGGLGSSASLYLASSGVGTLGLLDHDVVHISNLHRQVVHDEKNHGRLKVESAAERLSQLNSSVNYVQHPHAIACDNALGVLSGYDLVLDCTDNVATRYILSDACVLLRKPLVSGAAIGMDGQVTVYNYAPPGPKETQPPGGCYRCRFLKPPSHVKSGGGSCADAGVLGPVPGLVGVLQAIEAIKIVGMPTASASLSKRLGMFDTRDARYMVMGLRGRNKACPVCSSGSASAPSWSMEKTKAFLSAHNLIAEEAPETVVTVCSAGNGNHSPCATRPAEPLCAQISCERFWKEIVQAGRDDYVLIDVRARHQFAICSLPNAINIPVGELVEREADLERLSERSKHLYTICRRGVLSQKAAIVLETMGYKQVCNVQGGLEEWARTVDHAFPTY